MCRKLIFLLSLVLVMSLVSTNVTFGEFIQAQSAESTDDYEEQKEEGTGESLDSSDLELVYEGDPTGTPQVVGIRFVDVQVPKGETILSAYVQFDADDINNDRHVGDAHILIEGELSPNPVTFAREPFNVTSRPKTAAQVKWSPAQWMETHLQSPDEATSDISAIIQEIIDQEEWAAGNALVLILSPDPEKESTGIREAESFDGAGDNVKRRPTLIVEFGEPLPPDEIKREAEDADVLGASWRVPIDPAASGAKYIGSENDDGNDNDTAPGAEWIAVYNFDAAGGDYKILFRGLENDSDSFWVRITTATSQTLEDPDQPGTGWVRFNGFDAQDAWKWDEVHSNDHDNEVVIWTLPAGENTLEIGKREDGTYLDGFIITNDLFLSQAALPDLIDPPPIAVAPTPVDGAIEVVESILEWIAAPKAVSHKIYLSTDETIDESDFLATTDLAMHFTDLDPGTTYYWRIDEVEAEIPVIWDSWEVEGGGAVVNEGDVWSFTTMALEAHYPSPSDGATWVSLDADLSWTVGKDSIMHDVYFGTDKAAVEAGDPSTFKGKLMDASFDPGPLEIGTTYYWKVDEFAIVATNPGPLWSFETKTPGVGGVTRELWEDIDTTDLDALKSDPRFPAEPTTADEVSDFLSSDLGIDNYGGRLQAWLTVPAAGDYTFWVSGDDETELYIGTSPGDAKLIASVSGWTSQMEYDKYAEQQSEVIALEEGQYYLMALWKEGSGGDNCDAAWQGPTIPERTLITENYLQPFENLWAIAPNPKDGEDNALQTPVLSFSAGVRAAEHDLYLGDDADAVANADVNTPDIYLGRQAETSLDAGALEWNKTYYWRVDEVNDADADSPWKGAVWSFTTADALAIDLSETTLDYDNSAEPFTSEASWDTPQDLTSNGVTDLSFRFLGVPGPEGDASLDEATGTYTITGSGNDIWGSSDQFHYVYRELSGDGSIEAQVVDNGEGTNDWAKGGVMIRQSLDGDSINVSGFITGGSGDGGTFQWRPVQGEGSSSNRTLVGIAPPYYVRLVREGNTFTVFMSADGVEWLQQGADPVTIEMKDPVLIGLAVTSHQSGEKRTFTFDNVSTTGKVSSAAANQDIGITSNSAELLYVALEDKAGGLGVVTHVDPAATQIDQWWTMKVPLLAFSDAGVDVADANKLYIGVGDVDNPTAGGSGTIRIDSIKVVKPISILEPTDVTAPGDNVRGVPNDGDWPGAETPPLAVDDNVETKYLHFKGDDVIDPNADPSGFKVTPLAGPTIVTGLTFTTANDEAPRDPVAYELYGSNVSIDGPYNLIASGDIADFNDATEWPRFTMNATPISFENATVYKHYQVLFPALRDAESANSMQIAEVELIGVTEDVLVDITAPGNTIYGYPTDGDWPGSENPLMALDNDIETNYRHKKGEDQPTGFVVTPSKKKVVNRLSFTTADDAPERDPVAFKFYGSNDDIYSGPWTLIASGKIDDFNQETPWPRLTKNETAIVFDNDAAYKHYRLMITDVRDAGSADSMQLAEVELIEALD